MTALAIAARFTHLAASVLLAGASVTLLLAGRSDRPTARRWEARVLGGARALVLVALAAGAATLAVQTALLEGRPAAALEPAALGRVLLETQGGHVWLVRHGLLLLLAAFLAVRWNVDERLDWQAARGEAALLGVAALGLSTASGHAAAVEGAPAAMLANGAHLAAAGVWIGGLPALALLCAAASREAGADARPFAVLAARRFSRWALAAVLVLVVSGALNAWTHVGSVAGFVGTTYGRLLLAKLALLVPILALGAVNRARHLPALSADAATTGRPAMRRLGRFVAVEAVLGLALLGVVATMGVTPPSRHEAPAWPFAFRLSLAPLEDAPALGTRALVGGQVAVLGAVAAAAACVIRAWRLPLLAGALVVLGAGAALALPPLAIDAYPTTYLRPAVPYQAASVASGAALYGAHCAGCHGRGGAGDGPDGWRLPRPPADLRAPHTAQHTAGDLFWWISHGIPRGGMPAFGARLGEEERWDLVNFVRALSSAHAARRMGPVVEPDRPWLVAPDFTFSVGPTPSRTLKEYRGRRSVLLVLYTLPGSRPRLAQLAAQYGALAMLGVEVVAAPTDAPPDAVRRLGAEPRILFPVATEGAAEIAAAYRLFAATPHAELLIDRQGYVRAIARGGGGAAAEPNTLLAEVQQLNEEKVAVAAPEEHVH
ncbi:MAG: CopD family protein [Candidatus Rokubacteria bacterium]|nr:CopD family protein [Candidatus Rokubacteria bacterium]